MEIATKVGILVTYYVSDLCVNMDITQISSPHILAEINGRNP
jgi:hypothetical protein